MRLGLVQTLKFLRLAVVAGLFLVVGCSGETPGTRDVVGGDVGVGVCESGARKMADDGCNFCACSDEGQWECTEKECLGDVADGDVADGDVADGDVGGDCVEGDTKKVECNTCVCGAGGNWSCTKIGCLPGDPCAGLACGAVCSTCAPEDEACLSVMQYCDAEGKCSTTTPSCPN